MSDTSNPENQIAIEANLTGNAAQQAAELSAQIVNLSQHLATLSQRAVQNANVTKAFNQSMGLGEKGVSQYSREVTQSLGPLGRMTKAVQMQKQVLDQATKSAEAYSAAQRMLNKGAFDPGTLTRSNAAMSQSVSHMKAMRSSSNDLQKAMKQVSLIDYSRRISQNALENQRAAYNFNRNFSMPLILGLREAFFSYSKLATESNRTTKLILDNFNQIGASGDFEAQVKEARKFTAELGKDLDKITRDWGTSRVLIQSLAGDFAELGISSRIVLGDLTRMTAETEKLGNLDISQSSEFIQTMYQTILRIRRETGKSVNINSDRVANEVISQLRGQLSVFNMIENKTVMSLRNIADAFPEVTAAATSFGLSMTEAMALVIPMIGAGFQVGASANSVKVSLQRMVAMTKQNTQIINQLNAEMGTGFKYSAGVGMENIQMLTDAYRTLSKSVSEGGKGKQGALEFFSRLFGVRQGPRMETAFAQLAAFQTSLETYGTAERKTADILQNSINAELAVIGVKKIAINQFLDLSEIHRKAIEKDSNDVLTAQALAIQKGQKKAQALLEDANSKNSDFISGMSTEVGKALMAQAFDVNSLAGKQFEAELKLSQDTPEVRYRRAKESLMAIGRAVVPVVDLLMKGLLPALEKIATFLQENPFAAKLMSALLGVVALSGPVRMFFTTMQTAFGSAVSLFLKLSRVISGTNLQFASLQDLIMNPNLLRGQQRVVQYLDGFLIKSKRGARELKEAYDFSGISLPAKEAIQAGGIYGSEKAVNMKRMQPFVPQTNRFIEDMKTMNAQSSAQMAVKVADASESGVTKGTKNLSSDLQRMFSTVMHRFQGPNLFAGPNYFEGNIPFGGTSGGPGSTRAPRAPRGSGGAIADDLTPEGSAAAIAANEARKARLRPLPFTTYPPGVSRFFTPRFAQADVRNLAIPSAPGSVMPGNIRASIARRQRLSGMFGPSPSTKLAGILGKGPLALPAGKTPLALGTGSWLSGQSIIQMFQDSGVKLEQQLLFALSNMPDTSVSPQTLEAVKKLIAKKTGIFKLALSETGVNKTMGKKFVTLPSELKLGKKFNDTLIRSELAPILNHIDTSIGNQVIAQVNGKLNTIPKQAVAELKEIAEYFTPMGVHGNVLREMKKITTINGVSQFKPVLKSDFDAAFEQLFITVEDTTGYVVQSAQSEIGDALMAIQQEFPDLSPQALVPHPKTGRLGTGSLNKHGDMLEMFQVELANGAIRLQDGVDELGRATVQIVQNSVVEAQGFIDNGVDFYGDLNKVEDKAPKVKGGGATYGKAVKPDSAQAAKKRIAELKASAAKARGAARIQALKDLDDYIFEQEALVLASRGTEARDLLYNPYKDQEKSALTLRSVDEKRRRIAKIKKDMPGAIAKGDIPITAQALAGKYEEFDAAIAGLENSIKEEQALIDALPANNPRKRAAGLQKLAKPHNDNIEKLRKDIKKYQTMRNRLVDSPAALEAQIEKELATLTRAAPAPLSDVEKLIESERKKLNTKLLSAGDSDLKRRATRKNLTTVNLKERIKRMYEKVTVAGKKLEADMTEVLSRPERLQQWFSKNLYKIKLPDGSEIERFVGSEFTAPPQPAMQSGRTGRGTRRRSRAAQLKDSILPTLPPSRFFGPQFDQARIPTVTDFYGKPFRLKDYPLKTSFAQRLFQRPLGVGANLATTGKDIATQFADNLDAALNGILKSSSTEVSKISSAIKKIASHTGHSAAGKNTLAFLQNAILLTDEQINEAMQASITDITRTFRAQTAGGLAGPGTKSQSPASLAGFFERLRLGLSGKNAKGEKTKVVGVTEAFFGKNFNRLFNKNPGFDSTAGLTNNLNTLFANAMKSAVVGLGSVVEAGSDSDTDRRNAGELLQPGQERQRSTRKGVQASKKRVRKAIKDAGREALDKVEEVFDEVNQPLLDYSTKLSNEFNNLFNQQQAAVSAVTQSIPSGKEIGETLSAPIVQAQNAIEQAVVDVQKTGKIFPLADAKKTTKPNAWQKAARKQAEMELAIAMEEINASKARAAEIVGVKPVSVNKVNARTRLRELSDLVKQEEKNLTEAIAAAQATHPNLTPGKINNLSSVKASKKRLELFKKDIEDLEKYITQTLAIEQEKARVLMEKSKTPRVISPTKTKDADKPDDAVPKTDEEKPRRKRPKTRTGGKPVLPDSATTVFLPPTAPSGSGGAGKIFNIDKIGHRFQGPNIFSDNIFSSNLKDIVPNFDELMSAPVAESGATLAAAGQAAGAALAEGAAAVQAAASSAAGSSAVSSRTGNQSLLSRMKERLFGSKFKLTGESGDAENIIKNKMGKRLIKKGLSLDFNTDGAVTGVRKVSQFGRVTQIELEKANRILSGKLIGNFSRLQTILGKKTFKVWLFALTGGLSALVGPAKKALSAMKELATSGNYGMSGARKAINEMKSFRDSQGKSAGKIRTVISGIGGFFDGGIAKAGSKLLDLFAKIATTVLLVGSALLIVLPIIAILVGFFGAWKSASGRLDSSMQNLKDAFAAIKEAVAALFAPIRDVINEFTGGNKVLGQFATEGEKNAALFYSITGFIKKAAEAIKNWAKTTGAAFMKNTIAPQLVRIINKFILLGSAIKDFGSGKTESGMKKIKAIMWSFYYDVINIFKQLVDGIINVTITLAPVFGEIAMGILNIFAQMFVALVQLAAAAGKDMANGLINGVAANVLEIPTLGISNPISNSVRNSKQDNFNFGKIDPPEGMTWVEVRDAQRESAKSKTKTSTDSSSGSASDKVKTDFATNVSKGINDLLPKIKSIFDTVMVDQLDVASQKYFALIGKGINVPLAQALKDPKGYKDALEFNYKKSADAATASGESLGSKIASGMKDKMKEIKDTLKGYFYSNVDAKFESILQQYTDALENQKEKQLKAYDDQIAGIDALAEAEERLTAKKDYETRRRELIDQRATDHDNYLIERRLAVYEGRAFDVRRLDREEAISQRDSGKEIQDLDSGRLSQLQSEQRDLAKQAISNQKELAEKQFQEVLDTFDRFIEDVKNKSFSTQEEFAAALKAVGDQTNTSSADLSKVFAKNIGELPGIIAGVRDPSIQMFSANMNDLIREASRKFGLDANVASPSTVLGAVRMMAEGSEAGFKEAFNPVFATAYVQPTVDAIAKVTSSLSEKGNKNNIAEIWQKAGEDAFAKLKNELNRDIAFPKILESFKNLLAEIRPLVQQIVTEAAKASAAMEGIGGKPEIADLPQSTLDEWTQTATRLMQTGQANPAQRAAMAASAARIVSVIASNLLRGVVGIKAILPTSGLTPFEQGWAIKIMAGINLPGSQVDLSGGAGSGPLVPKMYNGGSIGHYGRGGFLEAPASQGIPALLHGGEYIINHKAVEKFGKGNLERINALRHGGDLKGFASGGYMTTPGFANGGSVRKYGVEDQKAILALRKPQPLQGPYATSIPVLTKRNIDLNTLPQVANKNGGMSTIGSVGFGLTNKSTGPNLLLPSVFNNQIDYSKNLSPTINEFMKTGRHLGVYPGLNASTLAASVLHLSEQNRIGKAPATNKSYTSAQISAVLASIPGYVAKPLPQSIPQVPGFATVGKTYSAAELKNLNLRPNTFAIPQPSFTSDGQEYFTIGTRASATNYSEIKQKNAIEAQIRAKQEVWTPFEKLMGKNKVGNITSNIGLGWDEGSFEGLMNVPILTQQIGAQLVVDTVKSFGRTLSLSNARKWGNFGSEGPGWKARGLYALEDTLNVLSLIPLVKAAATPAQAAIGNALRGAALRSSSTMLEEQTGKSLLTYIDDIARANSGGKNFVTKGIDKQIVKANVYKEMELASRLNTGMSLKEYTKSAAINLNPKTIIVDDVAGSAASSVFKPRLALSPSSVKAPRVFPVTERGNAPTTIHTFTGKGAKFDKQILDLFDELDAITLGQTENLATVTRREILRTQLQLRGAIPKVMQSPEELAFYNNMLNELLGNFYNNAKGVGRMDPDLVSTVFDDIGGGFAEDLGIVFSRPVPGNMDPRIIPGSREVFDFQFHQIKIAEQIQDLLRNSEGVIPPDLRSSVTAALGLKPSSGQFLESTPWLHLPRQNQPLYNTEWMDSLYDEAQLAANALSDQMAFAPRQLTAGTKGGALVRIKPPPKMRVPSMKELSGIKGGALAIPDMAYLPAHEFGKVKPILGSFNAANSAFEYSLRNPNEMVSEFVRGIVEGSKEFRWTGQNFMGFNQYGLNPLEAPFASGLNVEIPRKSFPTLPKNAEIPQANPYSIFDAAHGFGGLDRQFISEFTPTSESIKFAQDYALAQSYAAQASHEVQGRYIQNSIKDGMRQQELYGDNSGSLEFITKYLQNRGINIDQFNYEEFIRDAFNPAQVDTLSYHALKGQPQAVEIFERMVKKAEEQIDAIRAKQRAELLKLKIDPKLKDLSIDDLVWVRELSNVYDSFYDPLTKSVRLQPPASKNDFFVGSGRGVKASDIDVPSGQIPIVRDTIHGALNNMAPDAGMFARKTVDNAQVIVAPLRDIMVANKGNIIGNLYGPDTQLVPMPWHDLIIPNVKHGLEPGSNLPRTFSELSEFGAGTNPDAIAAIRAKIQELRYGPDGYGNYDFTPQVADEPLIFDPSMLKAKVNPFRRDSMYAPDMLDRMYSTEMEQYLDDVLELARQYQEYARVNLGVGDIFKYPAEALTHGRIPTVSPIPPAIAEFIDGSAYTGKGVFNDIAFAKAGDSTQGFYPNPYGTEQYYPSKLAHTKEILDHYRYRLEQATTWLGNNTDNFLKSGKFGYGDAPIKYGGEAYSETKNLVRQFIAKHGNFGLSNMTEHNTEFLGEEIHARIAQIAFDNNALSALHSATWFSPSTITMEGSEQGVISMLDLADVLKSNLLLRYYSTDNQFIKNYPGIFPGRFTRLTKIDERGYEPPPPPEPGSDQIDLKTGEPIGIGVRAPVSNKKAAVAAGFALGGFVPNLTMPRFEQGGFLEAPASQGIPAMLHGGEYIINHKAVERFGKGNLEKINALRNGGYLKGFANGGYMTTPGFANGGYMTTPGFAKGGAVKVKKNVVNKPKETDPNESKEGLIWFTNKNGESYWMPDRKVRSGAASGMIVHPLDWEALAISEVGQDWRSKMGVITRTSEGVFVGPLNIARGNWEKFGKGKYGNFKDPLNPPSWENQIKVAELIYTGLPNSSIPWYRQPRLLDGFEGLRLGRVDFPKLSELKKYDRLKAQELALGGLVRKYGSADAMERASASPKFIGPMPPVVKPTKQGVFGKVGGFLSKAAKGALTGGGLDFVKELLRPKNSFAIIGGIIGGALGATGGPAGAVGGVIGGSAAGGGIGSFVEQLFDKKKGFQPMDIGKNMLVQGALGALGLGVGAVAKRFVMPALAKYAKPGLSKVASLLGKGVGKTSPYVDDVLKDVLEKQGYLLHHSKNSIKIGDFVRQRLIGSDQVTAGDALPGYSYAWDALTGVDSAIKNQVSGRISRFLPNGMPNLSVPEQFQDFFVYLTRAQKSKIYPDLNVPGSSARAVSSAQEVIDSIKIPAIISNDEAEMFVRNMLIKNNVPFNLNSELSREINKKFLFSKGSEALKDFHKGQFEEYATRVFRMFDKGAPAWAKGVIGEDAKLAHDLYLSGDIEKAKELLYGQFLRTAAGQKVSGLKNLLTIKQLTTKIPRFEKGGYLKFKEGGEVPSILHGGEYVLNAAAVKKYGLAHLEAMNQMKFNVPSAGFSVPQAAYSGNMAGGMTTSTQNVNIYVDNFIGEPEWFNSMMKDYNTKILPKNQKAAGLENRVISTYNGLNRGQ